jgi:site-specific DNA-methyltransferase (adenine-specific)
MILWASKAAKGSGDRYTFNYAAMKAENDGRQMKNVWRFTAPGGDEKSHGKHPTQKPLALIERCLLASTQPGDLVVDPFSGSASTGVAALSHGRRFIGAEIDPNYCKLASKRLRSVEAAHDQAED